MIFDAMFSFCFMKEVRRMKLPNKSTMIGGVLLVIGWAFTFCGNIARSEGEHQEQEAEARRIANEEIDKRLSEKSEGQ